MAVRGARAVQRLPGPPLSAAAESVPDMIRPHNPGAKRTGKPGAGEPHAGFDVAGAGDVTMGAGLRPEAKAEDEPPDPTVCVQSSTRLKRAEAVVIARPADIEPRTGKP